MSYYFARQTHSQEEIQFDLQRDDGSTIGVNAIVDWKYLFRETCTWFFVNDPVVIGGPGVVVEIDETVLTKRKYHRGQLRGVQCRAVKTIRYSYPAITGLLCPSSTQSKCQSPPDNHDNTSMCTSFSANASLGRLSCWTLLKITRFLTDFVKSTLQLCSLGLNTTWEA